jgi:predicted transcriptional regulator of viral defense system
MWRRHIERRDPLRREVVSTRLRAMLSAPSLLLTARDVENVLGLVRSSCERILHHLEENGVLREVQRGVYVPTPLISGIPRP